MFLELPPSGVEGLADHVGHFLVGAAFAVFAVGHELFLLWKKNLHAHTVGSATALVTRRGLDHNAEVHYLAEEPAELFRLLLYLVPERPLVGPQTSEGYLKRDGHTFLSKSYQGAVGVSTSRRLKAEKERNRKLRVGAPGTGRGVGVVPDGEGGLQGQVADDRGLQRGDRLALGAVLAHLCPCLLLQGGRTGELPQESAPGVKD